jgi:hypothetical protein
MSAPQRPTVKGAIASLKYCCPYAFFRLHRRTGMIALRLGFGDRAIRYWKMAYKDGKLKCGGCGNCLKGRAF